jgi:hypothetical protein
VIKYVQDPCTRINTSTGGLKDERLSAVESLMRCFQNLDEKAKEIGFDKTI